MAGDDELSGAQASEPERRYCRNCGEIFQAPELRCPNCRFGWVMRRQLDIQTLTSVLTDLPRLRETGVLSDHSYVALRDAYEYALIELRPARWRASVGGAGAAPQPTDAASSPDSATPAGVAGKATAGSASLPAVRQRSGGPTLAQWTAARQADILLYLGAFMLSIAALIFVGYQGETLSGLGRFGVLLGYTVAFLSLGFRLPRWQRVREAGAVFLALGALLVPVNFIALRVQVLGGVAVPDSTIWLVAASVTAGLHITLGLRGFGRLYFAPGAAAAIVAWGALGAVLHIPLAWYGAWFVAGAAALNTGWLAASLAGGRVVEIGSGVIGAFALLYAHGAALFSWDQAAQLPLAYGLATAALAINAAVRRGARWAPVPAFLALSAVSASWWKFGVSGEWYGVFAAAAALGYCVLAELDRSQRRSRRETSAVVACLALLWAQLAAMFASKSPAQLPLTYGLLLAGAAWDGWRHRDAGLLTLPLLAASAVTSLLWAASVEPAWWAYPWGGAALFVLSSEPWWRGRPILGRAGWPYLLALASGPVLVFALVQLDQVHSAPPVHGLVTCFIAMGVLVAAVLRSNGALAALWIADVNERARRIERQILEGASIAFLFGAAAYLDAVAGLHGGERGWVFAALGFVAWIALGTAGRGRRQQFNVLVPAGVAGTVVAGLAGPHAAGSETFGLTLAAAGSAFAFPATRRWSLWLLSAAFAAGAVAFFWQWRGFDSSGLPVIYVGCAAVLWGSLTNRRRYAGGERDVTITVLSWATWALALAVAWLLVLARTTEPGGGHALVRTREWSVFAFAVAAAALAITAEGLRLQRRAPVVAGSAGLLLAALLLVATAQPANMQAYALPVGLYLVSLGLVQGRSERFLGAHMSFHEAVVVLGLLFLVLPPTAQSFAPGGDGYVFELLGEGLVCLAVGFALDVRWLVAGGVLTFTGVGVRALTVLGTHAPYWLTLGISGMTLLAVGMLLLLQRERWDRARLRIAGWWLRMSLDRES